MASRRATAAEHFHSALDHLSQGDLGSAVAYLRAAFFENLYVAPILLDEPYEAQNIWYPSVDSRPRAATEYVSRYGDLWRSRESALDLLREVWSDTLVRGELKSYVNLSKSILQSQSASQKTNLLEERELFVSLRRILRTQSEILARLRSGSHRVPPPVPRVALILLAARDPAASVDFYRQLLGIDPSRTSRAAGGYAEFELPGVRLAIHGHDRLADGDPYDIGPPPQAFGWGAVFVIQVGDFDRYVANVAAAGILTLDEDRQSTGRRYLLVRDPSGYLIEITEETDPRGA
jgi:catechol 2,3-dioxygenase-like lactoylglutathione lyase family enzyme